MALIAILFVVPVRADASPAKVAALQAALSGLHLYDGYVDGIDGPLTRRAVTALQRRRGLSVDGIAGPQTRRALGWRGRPGLGSRVMRAGDRGWDVAALQFLLQRAGHGPGRADGLFGPLTRAAVERAQGATGITVDGLAGPATISSLRGGSGSGPESELVSAPSGPVRFLRPVPGPIGDGFGAPRSGHLHTGVDFPVPYGTRVGAAGVGTTIYAGYNYGGYGNLVVIQHRLGYTTWYAHLSSIATSVGAQVEGGTLVGYVGSTGNSTGPHLHFEVRRYDTPIDPVPLLLTALAARAAGKGDGQAAGECAGRARHESVKAAHGSDWIARERLCAGSPPPVGR
ncbi:MAG TPA: peptidoglycan DD-metalloendopeptidase family protein [Solirubrobacterales bacterium]|nr:peptidoglycan DD-metalloendopeptidase family protein [Solirubrobacterales bacterium]